MNKPSRFLCNMTASSSLSITLIKKRNKHQFNKLTMTGLTQWWHLLQLSYQNLLIFTLKKMNNLRDLSVNTLDMHLIISQNLSCNKLELWENTKSITTQEQEEHPSKLAELKLDPQSTTCSKLWMILKKEMFMIAKSKLHFK